MSTINLAVEKEESGYKPLLRGGVINALIVLLVALALYGALVYMNKKVVAETQDIHSQYMDEYTKFLDGKANGVIDFKNRSVIAGKLLDENLPMQNIFAHLEESILPSVYLTSMDYNSETKTLELSCVTDSLDNEARQVASFQENAYFSSFSLGDSSIESETGLINFGISLNIK